jgi:hypothetical protein
LAGSKLSGVKKEPLFRRWQIFVTEQTSAEGTLWHRRGYGCDPGGYHEMPLLWPTHRGPHCLEG